MTKIPFVDLYAQYLTIKDAIDLAIGTTIKNSSYIGGGIVKKFEEEFGNYLGCKHVISCANGTDSIEILLEAYGIGKGDEVIVPAISWISTSEAVSRVGAIPVFVDIEEDYYTINPELIERSISTRTKAIIPVHLYGQPAAMSKIMEVANKFGLIVIEDCAQAHGAEIDGKKIGTIGHAASFSFYPGKNLGAYGDAGAMVTNDEAIAIRARMIANHGQQGKHNHVMEGRNSRLDGLQAAILSAKLPYLKNWTAARIEKANEYEKLLSGFKVKLPKVRIGVKHVFHLYVIAIENREAMQKKLWEAGVETAIHYPMILPQLPCYSNRKISLSDYPVAQKKQHEILSLPIYPELTLEQINYISTILNSN